MKTDRELLEAAAKAAGVDGECRTENLCHDGDWSDMTVIFLTDDQGWWSPLHDDGDALRLAVKLNMWQAMRDGYQHLDSDNDILSATRRAIVRAAAAMVAG